MQSRVFHYFINLFIVILIFGDYEPFSRIKSQNTINSIIGDVSFYEKFGALPNEETDETLRIKTHLDYVIQKLESKNNWFNFDESQIESRKNFIEKLKSYSNNEVFPSNFDFPNERLPCFIDENENICAVGYLVEKSVGLETAKTLNEFFKYDKIYTMNSEALGNWITESGFSKDEIAMIQPQYGPQSRPQKDSPKISKNLETLFFTTSLLGSTSNGLFILKKDKNNAFATFGILAGVSSLGIAAFDATRYKKENYILGSSSLGISLLSLIIDSNRKPNSKVPQIGFGINPLKNSYSTSISLNWNF